MNRIELSTRTDATVSLVDDFLPDGAPVSVVIVKQRFGVFDGAALPVPGAEILLVDTPWDAERPGSPKLPSDLALLKPSTDVIVCAEAVARGAAEVTTLDAHVSVGDVARTLRVHGPRVWYESLGVMQLTPPERFTRVPLKWELAWGGRDADPATGRTAEDPRNPYGRGVCVDPARLRHQPGPQIELPELPITSHLAAVEPVGVAASSPLMLHRRRLAGTMDARWQRERMPLRPNDFDLRFHQCAAPGMVSPAPLVGGERVRMVNLSPGGPMEFSLPRRSFAVWGRTDAARVEYRCALDTVVLLPGEGALEMVWRTRVPIPPGSAPRLRAVQVYEREVRA